METVSVVIPTYNRERLLPEAIDSVLSQTVRASEIIVIDDGSTDKSEEVFERYSQDIILIRQRNSGASAARNAGIRAASGSLIAFLDSDDIWLPNKLARELECFNNDPELALVHSDVFSQKGGVRVRAKAGRKKFSGNCYFEFFSNSPEFPSLPTVVVRASAIARVGVFDESLRTSEDIDLWLRIARFFRFGFVDEPLVIRRVHGENLSNDMSKFFDTDLAVYEKALKEDPNLLDAVGRVTYFGRLSQIAYSAGYWNYKNGCMSVARRFLIKSLLYVPSSGKTWILLCWTAVPNAARVLLLALRRRITGKL